MTKENYKKIGIIAAIVVGVCALAFALYYFVFANKSSQKVEIEYITVRQDKDGSWGMLGPDGQLLFTDEFDSDNIVSWVVNGVFTVMNSDGITVYTADKKPKAIKGLENLKQAGLMSNEGLMPIVRKGERITFVDKNGKEKFVLSAHKGKEIVHASTFYDGLSLVRDMDDKYGFVNTSGKMVIEPKYDIAATFSEGLTIVGTTTDDKTQYSIIDKSGKVIKKLGKDISFDEYSYKHGYFPALQGESEQRIVFLDKKGNVAKKFPKNIKRIGQYDKDVYIFQDNEYKWGVKSMKDDETIIRAKYDQLYMFKGKYIARQDKKVYLINSKDDKEVSFDESYTMVIPFLGWDNLVAIDDNEKIDILSPKGKVLTKDSYYVGEANYVVSVTSDFFDVDGYATMLCNLIKSDGVDEVKFGQQMSKFVTGEASNYTYTDEVKVKSGRYGMYADYEITAASDVNIAERKYETVNDGWWSYDRYVGAEFNPNSKVKMIGIEASVSTSEKYADMEKLCQSLAKKLQAKGFKLMASEGVAYKLKLQGNKVIVIAPENAVNIILMEDSPEINKEALSRLNKAFQNLKARDKGEEVSDDYVYTSSETEVATETATVPIWD